MKRNLIYSVFAAILLASCSSDDIPAPAPAPETLDAYISLGITNGTVKTKADSEDTSYGDGDKEDDNGNLINPGDPAGTTAINSFTVAIFRGALSATATEGSIVSPATEPEGSLIYLNTFKTNELLAPGGDEAIRLCKSGVVGTADGKNYQINGIKVKAGNLHIIVMANMPDNFPKNASAKDFMKQYYSNLENEGFNKESKSKTYPCSMSSKWLEVKIDPTAGEDASADLNNKVYYLLNGKIEKADETTSAGESDRTFKPSTAEESEMIPLYRNVSAVGFQNITLAPAAGWGKEGGAKLKLKSVFVANAIGSTSLTAGQVPEGYTLHSGYTDEDANGALAANNKNMSNLKIDFVNEEVLKFPQGTSLSSVSYYDDLTGHKSVGKYFMVYENSKKMNLSSDPKTGSDQKTLLILCADYIYTDDLGVEHPLLDRYYAVVVNDKESSTGITGLGADNLVERNYIYKINLTIVGPGSINPYDPLYTANATAFVEAAPWTGAIDINQDAE